MYFRRGLYLAVDCSGLMMMIFRFTFCLRFKCVLNYINRIYKKITAKKKIAKFARKTTVLFIILEFITSAKTQLLKLTETYWFHCSEAVLFIQDFPNYMLFKDIFMIHICFYNCWKSYIHPIHMFLQINIIIYIFSLFLFVVLLTTIDVHICISQCCK